MKRLQSIEAMRGVAAMAVVLFHCTWQMHTPWIQSIGAYGWLGVEVFFVISGFVIPYSMREAGYSINHFPRFMARRIIRLEPPYLVSILLMLLLAGISARMPGFRGQPPNYSLGQIGSHIFYLVPIFDQDWLSPVYWTLAYEFAFYVIVGLTYSMLISRNVAWTVLFALAILSVKFAITGEWDYRIVTFAVGVLAMRLMCAIDRTPTWGVWSLICVSAIAAIGGVAPAIAVTLADLALVFIGHRKLGRLATVIGTISYSLYLTHVPIAGRIINFGQRFSDTPLFELGLVALAVAATIMFAVVFWWLIEYPSIRISRSFSDTAPPQRGS
jgi:peptidoglycan/LPS O-acetylase OafA/YrhL